MSESEETVIVEKMAELEAERFEGEGDVQDLLNFSVDKIADHEESPVTSTTDQLLDFIQPNEAEAEDVNDAVESPIPESSQQVEEVPEQVTSSEAPVSSHHEQEDKPNEQISKSEKELTSCMAKWFMANNVDKRIIDLVYWKCPKKTSLVFAGKMFILVSLTCCTLLSVVTLFSMSLLAVAFLYRIGMTVFNAVQKTSAEHPFKPLLDSDLDLSEETVQHRANEARLFLNTSVKKLKKLFLIEDVVESIKFGVLLWLLSYIGAWFSMTTIAILGCIYVFSVPVMYERNQEKVDSCLSAVKSKFKDVFSKVQDKLPEKLRFGKAKEE